MQSHANAVGTQRIEMPVPWTTDDSSRGRQPHCLATWILLGLVLACSGSVFYVHLTYQLPAHLLLFSYVTVFLFSQRRHISSRMWSAWRKSQMLWAGGLTTLFLFAPGDPGIIQYLYIFARIYAASAVVVLYAGWPRRLYYDLYVLLQFILYHSLAGVVLAPFVMSSLTIFTDPIFTFHGLFFYVPTQWSAISIGPISLIRNSGIFWEAGVLQFYLNLLLFLSLFIHKSKRTSTLAVLGILTTWSTTGLLIMSMQFAWWYISYRKRHLIFVPVLLCVGLPFFMLLSNNINEKIYGDRSMSYRIRLADTEAMLNVIKERPFIGIGVDFLTLGEWIEDYRSINDVPQSVLEDRTGNSNSLLVLFASLGVVLATVFLYLMHRQKLLAPQNTIIFAVLILTLLSEPLCFTVLFLMFPASGLISLFTKREPARVRPVLLVRRIVKASTAAPGVTSV